MSALAAVACIITDRLGRTLWAVRPEGKTYAGWLDMPGGKVEYGEPPEVALRRELREELAIEVGPLLFIGTYGTLSYNSDDWYVTLAFRATPLRHIPGLKPETEQVYWLPPGVVPDTATPPSRYLIENQYSLEGGDQCA